MQKLKLIFNISVITYVVSAAVLFRSSSISRREIKNVKMYTNEFYHFMSQAKFRNKIRIY